MTRVNLRPFGMVCPLLGLVLLCTALGRADGPPATSQPASQPTGTPGTLSPAADQARLARLEARVDRLDGTVSELVRLVGGPTRSLTVPPDTDLRSLNDRLDRELRALTNSLARLRREVDSLSRQVDRLERRR